ncbi:hypothetical protein PAXINDRAFT_12232 [Paxillus involutus ATCC 200175]|uniref:Uncharacterized protein n=1 Tax=Paxillus involutus ATCC 200175 TaxID=664439 RepID=A0A0C9TXG5_PAXIN|nr:hypothetical protein PAXINDRAFT_12232 [Paxillus involutus ATCC 200175]
MLPFAIIFGVMLIVQQFTYTVVPRRLTRRLGIGGTAPPLIDGIIHGLFTSTLEPVASTAAVNDVIVGTALVLYALFDEVEIRWIPSPKPLQIADRAFDWEEDLKRNPERYLDDIVPCPRDTPEDFFCRRWQIGASGALKTYGPHVPGWLRVKWEMQGQGAQSSGKPKTGSNPGSDDSKARRAHPRFELPIRSAYVDIVALLLQCLAFQYLHEWFLDNSADDVERRTWIPIWICALVSAAITLATFSIVPPSDFSSIRRTGPHITILDLHITILRLRPDTFDCTTLKFSRYTPTFKIAAEDHPKQPLNVLLHSSNTSSRLSPEQYGLPYDSLERSMCPLDVAPPYARADS